ncbi:MAG: Uma2 family endonuclease [Rhodobacteraceae bacterium]|nr:Uma2 family endonuclease [Paracoccaceae bacterium]
MPTAARTARPGAPGYQDVLDAPPHMVAQIIEGTLHTQPRPAPPHALASSGLGYEVTGPFGRGIGGPGGWWILDEPELHLGADILVPDLAGWRRKNMPRFPKTAFFTTPPDWVCEVLSPATKHIDLGPKRDIYAREGVSHIWFLDPDARTLDAFRLHTRQWHPIAALAGEADVSVPPFQAISFTLADLWIPEPD